MTFGISSAADYLSSNSDALAQGATKAGGGMVIDPFSAAMFGVGAISNVVGGIFQGKAQQRAAQLQANAANGCLPFLFLLFFFFLQVIQ